MKRNLIIFGSVALLGVGAFIFFRKKNTELPSGQGTTPPTGAGTTTPTGAGTTTPTGAGTTTPTGAGATTPTGAGATTPQVEPTNFLQQIKRKEAQRILDWVTKNKPSIAETSLKFQKIKTLGYDVVGANLVYSTI